MSSEEIDEYLETTPKILHFFRLQNQIDYEDMESPIKTTLAKIFTVGLNKNIRFQT